MTRRRVAVTGVGMVTPCGNDAPTTWASLLAGRSGVATIREFDARGFPVRIAGEIKNLRLDSIRDRKMLKFASRSHRFALVAAEEALTDAGIRPEPATSERWGFTVGGGMMGVDFQEVEAARAVAGRDGEFHPDALFDPEYPADPVAFCRSQANTGLSLLTRYFGIRGYATSVHTACASGGQAIGMALRVMRRGLADYVLAGGYDSMLNGMGLASFCLLGALSTYNEEPARASRPFDITRNGFVLAEGSGFLVLEDFDAARERGARIYAELAGDGNSLSSYRITDSHPSGDGLIQALQQSLANAGIVPGDVDYVNAHGTSTLMNDRSECAGLRAVMGDHIDKLAVSSTKSCTGHMISAAGAVEAGVCALAIRDGIAPVSANLVELDPLCNVNIVRGESRPMRIRTAVSNSMGFGGSNSCLTFIHPDGLGPGGRHPDGA